MISFRSVNHLPRQAPTRGSIEWSPFLWYLFLPSIHLSRPQSERASIFVPRVTPMIHTTKRGKRLRRRRRRLRRWRCRWRAASWSPTASGDATAERGEGEKERRGGENMCQAGQARPGQGLIFCRRGVVKRSGAVLFAKISFRARPHDREKDPARISREGEGVWKMRFKGEYVAQNTTML